MSGHAHDLFSMECCLLDSSLASIPFLYVEIVSHKSQLLLPADMCCVQAGLPDGTHIARIQDGVALLQCAQDWQACLSLNPVQLPESADISATQLPELERGQAMQDSQGKSEGAEAQVPPACAR